MNVGPVESMDNPMGLRRCCRYRAICPKASRKRPVQSQGRPFQPRQFATCWGSSTLRECRSLSLRSTCVHDLQRIAEQEEWLADEISIMEDEKQRGMALGTSRPGFVITFWWD